MRLIKYRLTSEDGYPRLWLEVAFDRQAGPVVWASGTFGQVEENEQFLAYHLLDGALRRAGIHRYLLIPYAAFREPLSPGGSQTVPNHIVPQ